MLKTLIARGADINARRPVSGIMMRCMCCVFAVILARAILGASTDSAYCFCQFMQGEATPLIRAAALGMTICIYCGAFIWLSFNCFLTTYSQVTWAVSTRCWTLTPTLKRRPKMGGQL